MCRSAAQSVCPRSSAGTWRPNTVTPSLSRNPGRSLRKFLRRFVCHKVRLLWNYFLVLTEIIKDMIMAMKKIMKKTEGMADMNMRTTMMGTELSLTTLMTILWVVTWTTAEVTTGGLTALLVVVGSEVSPCTTAVRLTTSERKTESLRTAKSSPAWTRYFQTRRNLIIRIHSCLIMKARTSKKK